MYTVDQLFHCEGLGGYGVQTTGLVYGSPVPIKGQIFVMLTHKGTSKYTVTHVGPFAFR